MSLEKIANKIIETDVVVVGGGIAGCPAAAKAAEHGLDVTLVEKAHTERSGSAAAGIDHYGGAFDKGMTVKEWHDILDSYSPRAFYGLLPWGDPTRIYRQYANGMWAIEELEKLGVTMRWTDGELRFIQCHHEGKFIRVHWQNVKPEMAKGIRERGVNILERTMVVDFLTDNGRVVGVTAVNTRTGEFMAIKAKAVVVATAECARVFNPETPLSWRYKYRYHWAPSSVSGDGWAMAYRAGAELANMEQAGRGMRMRDDLVMSFGNHGNEGNEAYPMTYDGIKILKTGPNNRKEMKKLKKDDPDYFSLEHLSDDFHKRIEVAYVDERLVSFKLAEERGFDPKTHWFEHMDNRPNQLHVPPGIWNNQHFMSSIDGLYVIGDAMAGNHDVANAATSGFLVGDTVGDFIKDVGDAVIDEDQVQASKAAVDAPLNVKKGTEPEELEVAIRYVCNRYIGVDKVEGRLLEGRRRLRTLRREFLPQLKADTPHYLMRALEVRNLMDMADLHCAASLERKETRDLHIREDFPDLNPELDGKLIFQRLEDGKPVIEWKEREPMAFSDDHKEER
ncbi:MAG: FAD-dependent oxidoreductase [Deltaproteobacteria bacterium]|nr:FAD-dependent oxidoreductase [Deltaproteobacteria bacterium]